MRISGWSSVVCSSDLPASAAWLCGVLRLSGDWRCAQLHPLQLQLPIRPLQPPTMGDSPVRDGAEGGRVLAGVRLRTAAWCARQGAGAVAVAALFFLADQLDALCRRALRHAVECRCNGRYPQPDLQSGERVFLEPHHLAHPPSCLPAPPPVPPGPTVRNTAG